MPSKFAFRFSLRTLIFIAFARLGALHGQGFAVALANMLAMATVLCAVIGVLKREAIFGKNLTTWDEAAGFLLMSCGLHFFA